MACRTEEVEKRLARFSSVEAKCFGMEEDMTAALADMSQIHNQLLAAEHANTELLGRQSGDHNLKERDMLESITRLEHQLKASSSSIEVWLDDHKQLPIMPRGDGRAMQILSLLYAGQ